MPNTSATEQNPRLLLHVLLQLGAQARLLLRRCTQSCTLVSHLEASAGV